ISGAWIVIGYFNAPLNFDDKIGRPITVAEGLHDVSSSEKDEVTNDLKKLNKTAYSDIEDLQENPNKELFDKEHLVVQEVQKLRGDYFSYLAQKSKIDWLTVGDENTNFFHRSLKIQQHNKRVLSIKDMNGAWCYGKDKVAEAFIM
ncbi:RNA-binding protein 44, partial [Bienertia sinuspersici]